MTPTGAHRRLNVSAHGTLVDDAPEDRARPPVTRTAALRAADGAVQTGHVPALDGVRGIAVIMVMAFHIWRAPVTAIGWAGVDLFFVLSGYLITGILWDLRPSAERARVFYLRRAFRILPLYYGLLLAAFVARPFLGLAVRRDDLALVGEHLWYWTYLCDWRIALGHPHAITFLSHLWTLSIEEQFYLVWPLVIWRCSRRTALTIASLCAAGALALRGWAVLTGQSPDIAYMLLPCRVDALAAGAILALAARGPGGLERVWRWATPTGIAGAGTAALIVLVRATAAYTDPVMSTIGYTALDWACGGLVVAAAARGSSILETPLLRSAGRYSYGLYVYHPLVMWWIVRDAAWLERSEVRFVAGAALGSVLVACTSYHLFEQPFLRLKDRVARRPASVESRRRAIARDAASDT